MLSLNNSLLDTAHPSTTDEITRLCGNENRTFDLHNPSDGKPGSSVATPTLMESLSPPFDEFNPLEGVLWNRIFELQSWIARYHSSLEDDSNPEKEISVPLQSNFWNEVVVTPTNRFEEQEVPKTSLSAEPFTLQPLGQLAQWSCLQLELWSGYSSFWRTIRTKCETFCILLYVIPRFNRMGCLNEVWKSGKFIYRCRGSNSKWYNMNLNFFFDDPFNHDKVFYIGLPKDVCPIEFYLKAHELVDFDYPNNAARGGNSEPPPCTYHLTNTEISTLRDGELVESDQVTSIGITLFFEESKSFGVWRNAILHYFDELVGEWMQQRFNPESGEIVLLQAKSISFVIKEVHADRWLKPVTADENFRISFPGSYKVALDGNVHLIARPQNAFMSPKTPIVYNLTTLEEDTEGRASLSDDKFESV
ncbi:hypothetical protein IE077_001181 [Cardiosporidium cionae]|uniref:Uncharacterized protein n=1 Tax=Cardiosporidium cionae TaxID=476202 RepID=A0ABQ7J5V0_9APIC|nr:hypothetical protein IE077_001181 [Cardiosporidium cionae]|eukprot:KAF8819330.1 hypothetical protein IE077_001181 [Cardiosporidium cionae]